MPRNSTIVLLCFMAFHGSFSFRVSDLRNPAEESVEEQENQQPNRVRHAEDSSAGHLGRSRPRWPDSDETILDEGDRSTAQFGHRHARIRAAGQHSTAVSWVTLTARQIDAAK